MGNKPRDISAWSRFAAILAAIAAVAALSAPGGATAGQSKLHYYHGTSSNGQYLNLTTGPDTAIVTFTRLWERCRPGFIHLLVNPVVLLSHAPLDANGTFSKTLRLGSEWTKYTGTVKPDSAKVRVRDSGGQICDGTDVTFKLGLIK